jgi:hypothetical protein
VNYEGGKRCGGFLNSCPTVPDGAGQQMALYAPGIAASGRADQSRISGFGNVSGATTPGT